MGAPCEVIGIVDLGLAASTPKDSKPSPNGGLHAFRQAFGTHLSKNGLPPRTAQAALRHSSLDLTMNVYTDPSLLDVSRALEALPDSGRTPTDPELIPLHATLVDVMAPTRRGELRYVVRPPSAGSGQAA